MKSKKILLSLIAVLSLIICFNFIFNTFIKNYDRRIISCISNDLVDETKDFIDAVDTYIASESDADLKKADEKQTKLLTTLAAIETFTPKNNDIYYQVNWIKREGEELKSNLAELLSSSGDKERYKKYKNASIKTAIHMSDNAKQIDKELKHNNTLWISLWVICLALYICKECNVKRPKFLEC